MIRSLQPTDRATVAARITAARVRAARVLCPDLGAQLATTAPIDTVVVNILDSDPHVAFHTVIATDFGADVLGGAAALGRVTGAKRTIAVIDADAPPDLLTAARQACRQLDVQLVRLSNPYPQAHPTLLLHTVLQRKLQPGVSPTTVGVLLLDAPAALAVGRAVVREEPMNAAPVVVRDHRSGKSHYASVDVGTPLRDVLAGLDIDVAGATVRSADLLRDQPAAVDDAVGTGELMFHVTAAMPHPIPDPCIRCGWCLEVCPTRIHPAGLLDAAQRNDPAMAQRFGRDACIECGMCTYVCPSRLPLLRGIRTL